jgi:cytochrome c biogenesis protein CcdA
MPKLSCVTSIASSSTNAYGVPPPSLGEWSAVTPEPESFEDQGASETRWARITLMLRLIGVVVSIGLADSVNPSMIAGALYLAGGERPRGQVLEFTLAVFVVYLAGGVAVALGPGQLLLSVLPHPAPVARHVGEVLAGVAMMAAAAFLWWRRSQLVGRRPPAVSAERKSGALLGAALTVVELPTAFPYLAAIGAIVDSGLNPVGQLALLLLFNVCFVLPLIMIVSVLWLAGERAQPIVRRARDRLERSWPVAFAGLALLAGLVVVALGVTGLANLHSS